MNELDDLRIVYLEYLLEILEHLPADEGRVRWALWVFLCDYTGDVRKALVRQHFEETPN
jgi:hypothetical protein